LRFLNRLLNSVHGQHREVELVDQGNKKRHHLSNDLSINRDCLKEILKEMDDIVYREIKLGTREAYLEAVLIYAINLVDINIVNENIIRPLNAYYLSKAEHSCTEADIGEIVNISRINNVTSYGDLVEGILSGNTILLMDQCEKALVFSSQGRKARDVEESSVESLVRGPRDSFVESIQANIGLIRSRLKTPSLKAKKKIIGSESRTTVYVLYIDNIVDQQLLDNVIKKLDDIQIDGIFESGYLEQYLEKSSYSPFSQMQITERPDKACANLLEGRVIILIDGNPQALILPITFFQLFQSPEDYYERILFGNFIRLLRYLGFIIATSLPSIYIALISFHHEMIPMDLMLHLPPTKRWCLYRKLHFLFRSFLNDCRKSNCKQIIFRIFLTDIYSKSIYKQQPFQSNRVPTSG